MAWWRFGDRGERETDGGVEGAVVQTERDPPDAPADDDDGRALQDASAAVAGADGRQAVVDALTAGLADASGLPQAAVWLHEPAVGAADPASYPDGPGFPSDPPTLDLDALPPWVPTGDEPRRFEAPDGPPGFETGVAGRVGDLGVVVCGSAGPADVGPAATRAVGVLGGAAAGTLDRVADDEEGAMATLHDATREMVTADSKRAAAETALDAAVGVLGLTQTGVHFHDPDERALVPVAWSGNIEEELGRPPDLGPDSKAWSVYEAGDSTKVDDLWADDGVHNPDTMFRSEMIVPLDDHGVVLFSSPEPDEFDDDDHRFAEVLASNLTVALDRLDREAAVARRNELLEELTADVETSVRDLAESAE